MEEVKTVKNLNDSEIKELELLRTFFAVYETEFAYSPHLSEDLFQKIDRDPQNLKRDQKGHLFACKDCFSKFFAKEAPSDFFMTFKSQSRNDLLLGTPLGKEGRAITAMEVEGKLFTIFIDGKEAITEKSEYSGAEIMELGGIPKEVGLIMILEDGTQMQVREDEVIELKPGRRFKKAPRFIRG
jgi:hypothetical protein